ncbi:hypothetical protein BDP27DRAFT_1344884 [Rhodocollybia butyracea]|uniref:Uncharacterized protein n=1 Tax=Rhodocollybia butyracea TaxID=206335 RepID=A0A9P5TW84_9AGAR|nr:hypothetical protein BDP27DRAFT_1344884 [Rhodocollybia butyracea]
MPTDPTYTLNNMRFPLSKFETLGCGKIDGIIPHTIYSPQLVHHFIDYDPCRRRLTTWYLFHYESWTKDFNGEDLGHKFTFADWGDACNIHYLDTESPPRALFSVDKCNCFAPGRRIRPSCVEIREKERKHLRDAGTFYTGIVMDRQMGAEGGCAGKKASDAVGHKKSRGLRFTGK